MSEFDANTHPAVLQGDHTYQLVAIQDAWAPSLAHVLQVQWLLPFPHTIQTTPTPKALHVTLIVPTLPLYARQRTSELFS